LAKPITREQAIRRGQWLRRLATIGLRLQRLLASRRGRSLRKEVVLDTEVGPVRTLWYGFENPEVAPLFFDLHGGGFILGNADMDEAMNLAFTQQVGCKVISIEYAKAPDFPYPVAVNQVYAVVKHVYENAGEYAIDGEKMAIGGHSAGGNLSTVTCMKAKKAGEFQFVCQVLDYPPLDLATSPLNKPKPRGAVPPWMAMIFDTCYIDPAEARDPYVSPVYATQEDLEALPPALLILAGKDSLHDEGLRYCELLKAAGVPTECHQYPNAAHGFTLNRSDDTTDAILRMVSFLQRHLS
jgi:acetyl esterase